MAKTKLKPGLNPGVPASIYHAFDAVSNSQLCRLAKSPAHYRSYMDHPEEKTDAMIFGSALHAYILEPDNFDLEFCARPMGLDLRRKEDKEFFEQFKKKHEGKQIIKGEEYEICQHMRAAAMQHPLVNELLGSDGHTELSILWNIDDILCKARVDRYVMWRNKPTIVDLKTTTDASMRGFAKSMYAYRYYQQAAMYLDGMSAIQGYDHSTFIFIAMEKEPPFAIGIYEIDDQALQAGRQEYQRLLALHRHCTQTQQWPSYASENPELITLPIWAFTDLEIELV